MNHSYYSWKEETSFILFSETSSVHFRWNADENTFLIRWFIQNAKFEFILIDIIEIISTFLDIAHISIMLSTISHSQFCMIESSCIMNVGDTVLIEIFEK